MLYAVTYELEGIQGPGGYVSRSRSEVLGFAKGIAEVVLDQLGDAVSIEEWYDLNGEEANPRILLQSDDPDQVTDVISQISDAMKAERSGYLDLKEYTNLFELADAEGVESWCSSTLRARLHELRKGYWAVVDELSAEWGSD
jgi:hypothetical protein